MDGTRTRFGVFEFSPASGELRREGVPVRLQAQPAKVLALLVSKAGELVTREQLQREIWGDGTHVDFERGLNFCIAQVRSALGDSSEAPRYLETVPKQGYRFVAPIAVVPPATTPAPVAPPAVAAGPPRTRLVRYLAAALLVGAAGFGVSRLFAGPPTVVVIPFYNETGNPVHDRTATGLSDGLVARLAAADRTRQLSVIGNAPVLRNPFARQDVQEISRKLGADYLIVGQLKSDGAGLRLVAHLIHAADMKHLWANTYDDSGFSLDAQARTAEAVATAVAVSLSAPK
jgi:DNA-binding winged helix-turn-helix (wHTH) protein/TolB-like protein